MVIRVFSACLLCCAAICAQASERIALVVGVDNYRASRSLDRQSVVSLPNLDLAVADAQAMATRLRGLEFEVDLLVDQPGASVSAERLVDAVESFASKLRNQRGEVALFYFAGHGVQGQPGSAAQREGLWLLPGDADLTKGDVRARSARALAFTELETLFREAGPDNWTAPVIVLDACRNELPQAGSRSTARTRGLPVPPMAAGALVAFATAEGELAFEPAGAKNGLYTTLLLEELARPGQSLAIAFMNAQSRAREHPQYRQQPELVIKGGRPQEVYLAGTASAIPRPMQEGGTLGELRIEVSPVDAQVFLDGALVGQGTQVLRSLPANTTREVEARRAGYESQALRAYIKSGEATEVRLGLSPVSSSTAVAPAVQSTIPAAPWAIPGTGGRAPLSRFRDCTECPEMVVIPAGGFRMGSPEGEEGRLPVEGPRRQVQVASFAMGRTEVTFAEYDRFAAAIGREQPMDFGWGRGDRPVVNVSWEDASAYAEWLSAETGQRYRLPSEAEWEYAARAGTSGPFSFDGVISPAKANYDSNYTYGGSRQDSRGYRVQTVPAGSLPANPWGLHEVHGNVWEWVADCWHDGYAGAPATAGVWEGGDCGRRVLRGGSWLDSPGGLRSAIRNQLTPTYRPSSVGFRLARTL